MVHYWKMDDFGRVEVAGLAGGWLAGRASLKMLEPKDPIRPRWGVKKRKRFWLPPKKDLLSVGWPFRISSSTGVKEKFNLNGRSRVPTQFQSITDVRKVR